jgi:uncharacterized SAM-binding protein YcdF (DUF218 family)
LLGTSIAGVTLGIVPAGAWLIRILEDRFPQAPLPAQVRGVVAISGEWFGERTKPLVALSKKYPNALVLYSGTADQNPVERFAHFGGDASRLIVEGKSEDTYENAQFSGALMKPKPDERWILITSAYHMPRAVGCFRRAGFRIDAYPVEYLHPKGTFGFANRKVNEAELKFALREWGALVVYRILGRTDSLFPGP